jgi:hypothetical protein
MVMAAWEARRKGSNQARSYRQGYGHREISQQYAQKRDMPRVDPRTAPSVHTHRLSFSPRSPPCISAGISQMIDSFLCSARWIHPLE